MQISKSRHLALPLCYAGDNKRTWPQLCTQWACAPPSMRRTTCQPVNHAHTKHTAQVMPTLAWCFVADGLTAVQGGVLRGAGVACPQFAHVGPHSPSICPHSPSFALIWCPQLVHTSTHWLRSTNAAVLVAHQAARRLCRSSHTQSRATALLSCCTRAHMRICARTCTQTHTHTHVHIHTHTCTHVHTHTLSLPCLCCRRAAMVGGRAEPCWVVGGGRAARLLVQPHPGALRPPQLHGLLGGLCAAGRVCPCLASMCAPELCACIPLPTVIGINQ